MSRLKHLLLLAPAGSIHTQRWANAFHARGLRVSVVSTPRHLDGAADAYADGVQFHRLPVDAPAGYVLNIPALHRIVRRLRPDIVHAHFASGYGTLGAQLSSPATVLSVWGNDVYEFPTKSRAHRALIGRNLHAYSSLTSTSESMKRVTVSMWPDLADKIEVVPFGVDTTAFSPGSNRDSHGAIKIGLCKGLRPKYGVADLIRAFAQLADAFDARPLELHLVGDGPQRAELEQLSRDLGVEPLVRFRGTIAHQMVPAFLRELDIFCALSVDDSESFGVAVVEAMAVGLPTVVSDVDGFAEVTSEASSLRVPRGDTGAAATALRRLCESASLRTQLGAAGRARTLEHYDWDQNVDSMISVYERTVGAGD